MLFEEIHVWLLQRRMWFVKIDGADAIKVAGYFKIEGDVLGMTWMSEAKTPLLLLSLASGMLEGMTPDLTQTHTGQPLPLLVHFPPDTPSLQLYSNCLSALRPLQFCLGQPYR